MCSMCVSMSVQVDVKELGHVCVCTHACVGNTKRQQLQGLKLPS